MKPKDRQKTAPFRRSIFSWFIISFCCFSLISVLAMVPLVKYSKDVFMELEIQKSTHHMSFGISQIEDTVTGVGSAAQNLRSDMRFLPFFYWQRDLADIPLTTGTQMQKYLGSLMFPLPLITDWYLQMASDAALTQHRFISPTDSSGYYPDAFCAKGLSYGQWTGLLEQRSTGFLPVQQVTCNAVSFDALVFSVPWTRGSYLFVCIDVEDLKASVVEKENLNVFWISVYSSDGLCLYSDLPEEAPACRSVTQQTGVGSLTITVHIPESVLDERMEPLYRFIGIYVLLCFLILGTAIGIGSHLSSKPLLRIMDILEKPETHDLQQPSGSKLQSGFHFIQQSIATYKSDLQEYRNTIDTQSKVLQARFLEKALNGALVTENDYVSFLSYFPDFPKKWCLILMGIQEHPSETEMLYTEPLSLVQIHLQGCFPKTYMQRINHNEILLVVDQEQYEEHSQVMNYLIGNISQQEPCYHAWGIVSKFYDHPRSIPKAYAQILDLHGRVDLASISTLCSVSSELAVKKTAFLMGDVPGIYNAITYGNEPLALQMLETYSPELSRSVYEMFRSILLCIKQDHSGMFLDVHIPAYTTRLDLKQVLSDNIRLFCGQFRQLRQESTSGSFSQDVKAYIDQHFTREDLSHTTLADHFGCSASKISKAFAKTFSMSVSSYISKKRLDLAAELLAQGETSVAEVAEKCGFSSADTFRKAYKRRFGHSPTQEFED